MVEPVELHTRTNSAKTLRAIADDIEENGDTEIEVVVVVNWGHGVELYAGGDVPNLGRANMMLDAGKRRALNLDFPEGDL